MTVITIIIIIIMTTMMMCTRKITGKTYDAEECYHGWENQEKWIKGKQKPIQRLT